MIHSDYHCKNMCIIVCTFLIALNFTYIYIWFSLLVSHYVLTLIVVSPHSAPPPPHDVSAMATTGSSITVTWTPPTLPDNRPPITGYTVTAVPSSGSTPEELPATATSTVLCGLQIGTMYTIKVVACNIIGDSSAASAQTFAG